MWRWEDEEDISVGNYEGYCILDKLQYTYSLDEDGSLLGCDALSLGV